MVTQNRLFAEFFRLTTVDVATGEAAAFSDPRTECDPATTGNEQREKNKEEEENSFLYRLLRSRCRCDKLMLLGAVSPTATLRIISIPCPSSQHRRLKCAPGETWFRDFEMLLCSSIL